MEQTATYNDLYYVGPREKEAFTAYINDRLPDRKLKPLIKNLFRPSYGGNRNVSLMYTLGGLMVSADDDMRPYALVEDSPESLGDNEFKGSLEIRPTLVEIAYFRKQKCGLPTTRVKNPKRQQQEAAHSASLRTSNA